MLKNRLAESGNEISRRKYTNCDVSCILVNMFIIVYSFAYIYINMARILKGVKIGKSTASGLEIFMGQPRRLNGRAHISR
jgi:uncharacterized membrane protein YagU involved in acid resistance